MTVQTADGHAGASTADERLDAFVDRAQRAATALRALDQEAVDRIVWAMVVAGLEHAVDLAELAMEETGFGVLEDKVVKNYIATEFLFDYLKDKRSVGRGRRGPGARHPVRRRADRGPAGPAADHQPDLDRALQGDRGGQDAQRRHLPAVRARGALREPRHRPPAGGRRGAPGCRPTRSRSSPTRRSTSPSTSSTTPASTSSGPPAARRRSPRRTRPASRASAWAPATRRCTCTAARTSPMAVVDVLISKTFDASVICPAEQMLVVDDAIHDAGRGRARAHGRPRPVPGRRRRPRRRRLRRGRPRPHGGARALVPRPRRAGRLRGRRRGRRSSSRPCRPTSRRSPRTRSCARSSCRCSASCARRPSTTRIAACELVTEHGGLGHTSGIYADDDAVIERYAQRIRTGRILVNAPTAVGALGGVYNQMTPTFSLGCGTWGGSTTTDNVNYRNLLNIKAVSRRQTPPQWFRVPSETYFGTGALENLRTHGRRARASSSRTRRARSAASSTRCVATCRPATSGSSRHRARADGGPGPRRRGHAGRPASRAHRRRRRRLGDRRGQGHAPVPREPAS